MAYLTFQICWCRFKCFKNNYELFTTCWVQIGPKIKNAQNLLKFGTIDISNIPISISMSKTIFTKCFYQISIFIKFQQILSIFHFGTNLGLAIGKYVMKIIFDIKIEIMIFEISKVPNFNKSWVFLILGPIWA